MKARPVQATAGYSAMGTGLPATNNFNAGVVVTWPIFNGFLTEHQLAEAKAKQNVVHYALADLESRVWLDVKSSYLELQNALGQQAQPGLHIIEARVLDRAANVELHQALGAAVARAVEEESG